MKKGELSNFQIISLVIVVVSFLIVLVIFRTLITSNDSTPQDVCHLSVLARATAPNSVQNAVPLKCTTQKICLTDGKGECAQAFAGEKIETIVLPGNTDEAARKIEEVTALAMYNCWSMMGEGKLDLFGNYAKTRSLEESKPMCVVCSRVAIDAHVSESVIDLVDVHRYIREEQAPGRSLTYLQAFTDSGVRSYASIKADVYQKKLEEIKDPSVTIEAHDRELAFVFSQIKSVQAKDALQNLGKDALVGAGGAYFTPGVGAIASVFSFKEKFAAIAVTAGVLGTKAVINAWRGQALASAYCGDFVSTLGEKEKGCSLVEAVPFSAKNINTLCTSIEGAP